ncbi:hypothetical protein IOK_05846 [Yersinia enterocolitica subsp. palearctica PhRBD_Ye1]|nr:hypothetical protein IOK_05846 [Yersinia enterocolitica subsp. palearctica PhRBD_Ye1]KGA72496.1 hypothetical protein DJ62_2267 [Yersinia enterocolitica]
MMIKTLKLKIFFNKPAKMFIQIEEYLMKCEF